MPLGGRITIQSGKETNHMAPFRRITPAATILLLAINVLAGDESLVLKREELRKTDVTNAVDRAMRFLKGKESVGGIQYSDYVVFCGQSVEGTFPQYKDVMQDYRKWIIDNDKFEPDYLYHSSCHVMALDLADSKKQAVEIFAKIKPSIFTSDGKLNPFISRYHLGWYLYGCIVSEDKDLLEKTFARLSEAIENEPDKNHYFTAYCISKAYERTKDQRYKKMFLSIVGKLKPFKDEYFTMAAEDGHMGMALHVFSTAFNMTQDKECSQIAGRLAGILVTTQAGDGSWNGLTAYTIMPAEGLTAYLKIQ